MDAIYNRICEKYDTTRKADPEISQTILKLLKPNAHGRYVDIACGTGNYTAALTLECGNWCGFDQSAKMLAQASEKPVDIEWSLYDVNQTLYPEKNFDGATCVLAIHHFLDLNAAFKEVRRILKPDAKLIVFTSTPEQMQHYWLTQYFPVMMTKSCEQMPSMSKIQEALRQNGFALEGTLEFFIKPSLQDFFLYSGKQRPEMYLSSDVRSGISSFANFCTDEELDLGLTALSHDINSGAICSLIDKANYHSDYLFISARRL